MNTLKSKKYKCCSTCKGQIQLSGRCPMANQLDCPNVQAELITEWLSNIREVVPLIPEQILAKAIKYHGYTGELRKSHVVSL